MNVITFTHDGDEMEMPAKYDVCARCEGEGKHVNPSIDGHGISAEEWEHEWSDEEREGYFRGDYDVRCEECKGQRVILVADEAKATPTVLAAWEAHLKAEADYLRLCESERRFGC